MTTIEQIEYSKEDDAVYKLALEPFGGVSLNMCHLQKGEELSNNENFSSYRVKGDIPMTGIVYINSHPTEKEISNLSQPYEPHYVKETLEEYLQKVEDIESINTNWIQKIVGGEAEQSKVLDRNDRFLIVRDWKFDVEHDDDGIATYKKEDIHLLGIPVERISSIRDIKPEHIPMLDEMKDLTLEICEEMFNLNRSEIKIYFHYPPSTYHLHVHYTWAGLNDSTTNFERAHDYDMVVKNIQLDPNYYRESMRYVKMTK